MSALAAIAAASLLVGAPWLVSTWRRVGAYLPIWWRTAPDPQENAYGQPTTQIIRLSPDLARQLFEKLAEILGEPRA